MKYDEYAHKHLVYHLEKAERWVDIINLLDHPVHGYQATEAWSEKVQELEAQLQLALDTEHGSGQHRILESLLNSLGHVPNSPQEAVDIAERLISEEFARRRKLDPKSGTQKKLI